MLDYPVPRPRAEHDRRTWTRDHATARKMANHIKAGSAWINMGHVVDPALSESAIPTRKKVMSVYAAL